MHRLALGIAAVLVLAAGKPQNALVNGGFEKGLDGWLRFDTTNQGRIEIAADAHEGKKSLLLERKGGDGVVMVRQDLEPPGKELTVAVSFRSKTGGKAHVAVAGFAANSDAIAMNTEVLSITGPVKAWTRKEAKVVVPDTVTKISLAIRAFGDGEFLFDDVVVSGGEKTGAKPPGLLANGGFESGLVGWEIEAPSGRSTFEPSADARRSGEKGLRVERTARCESPWDAIVAPLSAVPKTAFTVKAQARAEHAIAVLEVRFADEHGLFLKAVEVARTAGDGWQTLQGKAAPPRDAASASVALLVTGRGTIDLDDVEAK
jgi:carbohydrate binding protein with CBM4/9 domain